MIYGECTSVFYQPKHHAKRSEQFSRKAPGRRAVLFNAVLIYKIHILVSLDLPNHPKRSNDDA